MEFGSCFADVGGEEVVVAGFKAEGDPTDAAFDGDEFELWEAWEESAEEEVGHLEAVGHEEDGGGAGVGDFGAVDFEAFWCEAVGEVTAADVEGDGEAGVDGGVPDGVPVVVAQEGLSVGLGVAGEEDAAVSHCGGAFDFFGGGVDVPEGDGGVGDEAFGGFGDPVGLEVVPGLDAFQHEVGFFELEEALGAKAGDVGVEDLCVDAGLVHEFESFGDVEGGGVGFFVGGWRGGEFAFPAGEDAGGGVGDFVVGDEPGVDALVVLSDVRDAVAPFVGDAAGPEVGRFGDVCVGVDEGLEGHGCSVVAVGGRLGLGCASLVIWGRVRVVLGAVGRGYSRTDSPEMALMMSK